jgi:hypothetical protein
LEIAHAVQGQHLVGQSILQERFELIMMAMMHPRVTIKQLPNAVSRMSQKNIKSPRGQHW